MSVFKDIWSLVYRLKRLLPNQNLIKDLNFQPDDFSKIPLPIIHQCLNEFFQGKKSVTFLNRDATSIHTLFPHVEYEFILKQLYIFRDLPNRNEIVLRILLDRHSLDNNSENKASTSTKRPITHENGQNTSEVPEKVPKTTINNDINIQSTSNGIIPGKQAPYFGWQVDPFDNLQKILRNKESTVASSSVQVDFCASSEVNNRDGAVSSTISSSHSGREDGAPFENTSWKNVGNDANGLNEWLTDALKEAEEISE